MNTMFPSVVMFMGRSSIDCWVFPDGVRRWLLTLNQASTENSNYVTSWRRIWNNSIKNSIHCSQGPIYKAIYSPFTIWASILRTEIFTLMKILYIIQSIIHHKVPRIKFFETQIFQLKLKLKFILKLKKITLIWAKWLDDLYIYIRHINSIRLHGNTARDIAAMHYLMELNGIQIRENPIHHYMEPRGSKILLGVFECDEANFEV